LECGGLTPLWIDLILDGLEAGYLPAYFISIMNRKNPDLHVKQS